MDINGRRRALVPTAAIVLTLGLSACGTFDSAASGEKLIRDYVAKFGSGKVSVKAVSCPGDVKQRVGGTYDCKVTLHVGTSNADSAGTITIHMAPGDKVQIEGKRDLHLR